MLAFMPQSPLPDVHSPSSMTTSTMSLAILPSAPINYSKASVPTLLPPESTSSKRPKLSLNTTQTPTLLGGKGSTSLRLETLSAVSPTARNTFSNAYEPPTLKALGAKPQRPSLTPLTTNVPARPSKLSTPVSADLSASTNTPELTSSSSVSTLDSLRGEAPYQLAYNTTSILSNGPLPKTTSKKTSFARSRPMFPTPKKVAFRAPLTEDIRTTKYIMAHSDIESSSSTISTLELPSPVYVTGTAAGKEETRIDEKKGEVGEREASSPQTGEKRESSDEEDSDTCPSTPVAGRRKRHRQWRWTLGPVESAPTKTSVDGRENEAGIGEEQTEGT